MRARDLLTSAKGGQDRQKESRESSCGLGQIRRRPFECDLFAVAQKQHEHPGFKRGKFHSSLHAALSGV